MTKTVFSHKIAPMDNKFSHFNGQGEAIMVDVSEKSVTQRRAVATGKIFVSPEILKLIQQGNTKKGDVLAVARIAGINATKETPHLIPLCHTLLLQKASVDFQINEEECSVTALCTVQAAGQTGVEMEALTGVSVTLLTIYDMCKAVDKSMTLGEIHLVEKTGGKSGNFKFEDKNEE